MLSTIPSTMKGVSASVVTSKQPSFFRFKSAVGGVGCARRALAALGSNNTQLNMNMAKIHLAMAQEGFANRWNFNPVKEVPLVPGRYQWAPLSSGSDKEITSTLSGNVAKDLIFLKDITNPVITSSPSPVISESTNLHKTSQHDHENNFTITTSACNLENSENVDTTETKCKQVQGTSCEIVAVPKKNTTSGSQMCVTDFFRPQKRKTCNQYEDCQPNTSNTPPKKKIRTVQ